MAKGAGAILYIDVDSDDQYVDVGCIYALTPSGMTRGVVTGEACLGDAATVDETGDLKYTAITGTLQAAPNATVQASLETVMTNDTQVKWAIKHPLATPVYQLGTGKFSNFVPEGFERDSHMKVAFEIVPDAAYTYSTTTPTLEV